MKFQVTTNAPTYTRNLFFDSLAEAIKGYKEEKASLNVDVLQTGQNGTIVLCLALQAEELGESDLSREPNLFIG